MKTITILNTLFFSAYVLMADENKSDQKSTVDQTVTSNNPATQISNPTGVATNNAVHTNQIAVQENLQDQYIAAIKSLVQGLLTDSCLERISHQGPAVVGVRLFVNNSGHQCDVSLLTKKLRVALLQSGKAVTILILDQKPGDNPQQSQVVAGQQSQDFLISGKIIETTRRDHSNPQSTYSVQLSLLNPKGVAVWEGEKELTIQTTQRQFRF